MIGDEIGIDEERDSGRNCYVSIRIIVELVC